MLFCFIHYFHSDMHSVRKYILERKVTYEIISSFFVSVVALFCFYLDWGRASSVVCQWELFCFISHFLEVLSMIYKSFVTLKRGWGRTYIHIWKKPASFVFCHIWSKSLLLNVKHNMILQWLKRYFKKWKYILESA